MCDRKTLAAAVACPSDTAFFATSAGDGLRNHAPSLADLGVAFAAACGSSVASAKAWAAVVAAGAAFLAAALGALREAWRAFVAGEASAASAEAGTAFVVAGGDSAASAEPWAASVEAVAALAEARVALTWAAFEGLRLHPNPCSAMRSRFALLTSSLSLYKSLQ